MRNFLLVAGTTVFVCGALWALWWIILGYYNPFLWSTDDLYGYFVMCVIVSVIIGWNIYNYYGDY